MDRPSDIGKKFEGKKVTPQLRKYSRRSKVRFIRLYDGFTTSGRSRIPPQPSDYILVVPGGESYFVEFKYLSKGTKFLISILSPEQRGAYEESIEFPYNYIILIYCEEVHEFFALPSYAINNVRGGKKRCSIDMVETFRKFKVKKISEFVSQLLRGTYSVVIENGHSI